MFKILNYDYYIKNIMQTWTGNPVYEDDFKEGLNIIQFPNVMEGGEPLEFDIYKYNNEYYIRYSNPKDLHGVDGSDGSWASDEARHNDSLKNHFENYYSYYNYNDSLPVELKELINDEEDSIFLLSNNENVKNDILKLKDFLIKLKIASERS